MADRDKTLIEDGNLSNNNRKSSAPSIVPHSSSGAVQPDTHPTHHVAVSESSALKRKQTSFQITSVTVKGSRLSTDGGEDSADDLDESHTEDNSTVEVLECSKTADADHVGERSFVNSDESSSVQPPSEPVRRQADLHEEDIRQHPSETASKSDKPTAPSVASENPPDVNPPTLPDQWQHRFRVVKIVSSEPFKRGRWLCMDFMDPPAPAVESKPEVLEPSSCSGMPVISNSISDAIPADRVAHIYEISPSDAYPGSISVAVGPDQYQQPMYGIFLPINNGQYPFISGINTIAVQRQIKYTDNTSAANSVTTSVRPVIQQSQVFSSDQTTSSESHSQYSQQGQTPQAIASQMSVPSVGMVQVSQPSAGSGQTPPSTLQQPLGGSVPSSYPEKTSPPGTNISSQPTPMMIPQQHPESHVSMQSRAQVASQLSVQTSQAAMPVNVSCASNVSMSSSTQPLICSTSQASEISQIASSIPHQHISNAAVPQTSSVGTQATSNIPQVTAESSVKQLEQQAAVPSQMAGKSNEVNELGSPPSGSQPLQLNPQSLQSNFQPLQMMSQPNQAKMSQATPPVHQPTQSLPHPTQSVYQPNQSVYQSASQPVQSVSQPTQSVPQPTQSVQQPAVNVPQPSQAMQQSSQSLPQPSQPVQQLTQAQAVQQPIQSLPQHSQAMPQPAQIQAVQQTVQSLPQHSQSVLQPVQPMPPHSQAVQQPVQSIPQPTQTQAMQQPVPQHSQAIQHPVQSVPQPTQTQAMQQPVPQHSQAMQQPVQSIPQPIQTQAMQQPIPQHSQAIQQPVQSIPQPIQTQAMQQPVPQHPQALPQPTQALAMQQPNQPVQQAQAMQQVSQPVPQASQSLPQPTMPQPAQMSVSMQPSQGSLPTSQVNPAQAQETPDAASAKSDVNGEDAESTPSGSSTVAIDNKIEQAMDLVKSHLMFAVREEVDVLKEKITELMDRISQLEYENGFLKANASQQTLEQLNQTQLLQQQQQQSQPSVTVNSIQATPPQTTQQQLNMQNTQSTS